jgi:hypothetical protein
MPMFGVVDPGPDSLGEGFGPQLFEALTSRHSPDKGRSCSEERLRGDPRRVEQERASGYGAPVVGALVNVTASGSVDNMNLATVKCTFTVVVGCDDLVRCKLNGKLDVKVGRIFRYGRGAPANAVTLSVDVFWYCRVFDVQSCSNEG